MLTRSSTLLRTRLRCFRHWLGNDTKTQEDSCNLGQVNLPSGKSSTFNLDIRGSNSKSFITSMTVSTSTDGDGVSPTRKAGLGANRTAVRLSLLTIGEQEECWERSSERWSPFLTVPSFGYFHLRVVSWPLSNYNVISDYKQNTFICTMTTASCTHSYTRVEGCNGISS